MRRRQRPCGRDGLTLFLTAFGFGLLLALVCSVRLALFVAAVILIYVGVTLRGC